MPTGTGKTEVALAAMVQTGTATLVVAPIRDLMYQWHRRILKGLGYDAGIVGDNTFNLRPVTVTTYDSACIHMARIGAIFGLLIFDEEHHLPGPTYREAAIMSTAGMRLGLTATPERYDGREVDLDWLIGPVAYHMPFGRPEGRRWPIFPLSAFPFISARTSRPVTTSTHGRCGISSRNDGRSSRATLGRTYAPTRAKTPPPGWRSRRTTSSRRSRIGRKKSSGSWKTFFACTRVRRPSYSPDPTRWRWRYHEGSCCPRSFPTPARRSGWPSWMAFPRASSL